MLVCHNHIAGGKRPLVSQFIPNCVPPLTKPADQPPNLGIDCLTPPLSNAPHRTQSFLRPPMILSRLKPLRLLSNHFRCHAASAAAVSRRDTALWTPAPLIEVSAAAESLFHIAIDVSDSPELAASYTTAGQYLQVRLQDPCIRPTFLAIASPPPAAATRGVFEFLVKSIPGSTAELLCRLQKGDVVGLSAVMGKGFDVDRISPPENYQTVLIFATGAGIRCLLAFLYCLALMSIFVTFIMCSPIRSLIEVGFGADKRADVRLYYGARNLDRMAYQERFKDWESSGVNIVPVLSQPDESWKGERGFVQAAFARAKKILSSQSTGAVLCGHRQMAEEVTSILVSDAAAVAVLFVVRAKRMAFRSSRIWPFDNSPTWNRH
ncbi:FAD/NAD(P)-binding oxidoreductase [Striga asiatica]|uniref:FAD/NAD(P)-binding oxidoreductase n=1 Tax=Striga asiatica TaxID=4170 RepID=A0A5A7QV19_STRAF|nr:FAD/NAD(P)-binding oxidoreductase [Striga asiatica]